MKDQFDRKITYLRLSITDLCNLKCKYCMPETGVEKKSHSEILRLEEYVEIAKAASELGIEKIRITGGEPLVRRGVVDLVQSLKSIDGIKEVAMTTNGTLLKNCALDLKKAGLDRINMSIDTLDPYKYESITRGGNLKDLLDGFAAAKECELLPIKLNVVVINGFNTDEIMDFMALSSKNVEVRFIELMPIGEAAVWNSNKFISNKKLIESYGELLEELEEQPVGPAHVFKHRITGGKIGFINPISNHFCGTCNRIRVTADGMLKPCLHSDEEIDLARFFRDEEKGEKNNEALKAAIQNAIWHKPKAHAIGSSCFVPIERSMHRIGG